MARRVTMNDLYLQVTAPERPGQRGRTPYAIIEQLGAQHDAEYVHELIRAMQVAGYLKRNPLGDLDRGPKPMPYFEADETRARQQTEDYYQRRSLVSEQAREREAALPATSAAVPAGVELPPILDAIARVLQPGDRVWVGYNKVLATVCPRDRNVPILCVEDHVPLDFGGGVTFERRMSVSAVGSEISSHYQACEKCGFVDGPTLVHKSYCRACGASDEDSRPADHTEQRPMDRLATQIKSLGVDDPHGFRDFLNGLDVNSVRELANRMRVTWDQDTGREQLTRDLLRSILGTIDYDRAFERPRPAAAIPPGCIDPDGDQR
jgi:hypothetical protein